MVSSCASTSCHRQYCSNVSHSRLASGGARQLDETRGESNCIHTVAYASITSHTHSDHQQ